MESKLKQELQKKNSGIDKDKSRKENEQKSKYEQEQQEKGRPGIAKNKVKNKTKMKPKMKSEPKAKYEKLARPEPDSEDKYNCDYCNYTTTSLQLLAKYMMAMHSNKTKSKMENNMKAKYKKVLQKLKAKYKKVLHELEDKYKEELKEKKPGIAKNKFREENELKVKYEQGLQEQERQGIDKNKTEMKSKKESELKGRFEAGDMTADFFKTRDERGRQEYAGHRQDRHHQGGRDRNDVQEAEEAEGQRQQGRKKAIRVSNLKVLDRFTRATCRPHDHSALGQDQRGRQEEAE